MQLVRQMEKGHSSLKRNFWRCNTQQCASRLHLCLEPRDAIWTTLAHLACTDVSSCLSLKLISCSSALCSHRFSDKDCGQNMLIPSWMMSCRHSNRSSIISPWIRNRTLHWLWKIKLFFYLDNYHTFHHLHSQEEIITDGQHTLLSVFSSGKDI